MVVMDKLRYTKDVVARYAPLDDKESLYNDLGTLITAYESGWDSGSDSGEDD